MIENPGTPQGAPGREVDAAAKVHVTFFKDHAAKTRTTEDLTLIELRERVLNAAAREKRKLPWLKLAKFGNQRSVEGSLRNDANVTEITGIEVDYDDEHVAFDDALNAVREMDIFALVYTSPSHTPEAPRWRILAPASRPLAATMRAKLVARLNGFLKAKLGADEIAASESFTLSQAYYYGWVMNKPGLDHRADVIVGDFIDLRDDLAEFEPLGAKTAEQAYTDRSDPFAGYSDHHGPKRGKSDEELLALLKLSRATPGKGWREPMLRFIASTVGKGWPDLAIRAACARYSDGDVDDPEIQFEINYARKKFGKPQANEVEDTEVTGTAPKMLVDPIDLWGKFDPPSLTRGLLPDVVERFAHDQGMDMGADISGIAMSALVVCAAAIPDTVRLQVKRYNAGWFEVARLWAALVGAPSSKKSPIMAAAARPLRRIDADQARDYADQRAVYDKLPKEEKLVTALPKQVRSILQDTTIEAAQDVLKDSPDGLLCYQDELSGWFGSMDKYSAGRGSAKDRAFWLEAFNGGTYSVQRVGRGAVFIENLSISLLGGIQPEPIRKIADESVDDGLLQRLLPIIVTPAKAGRDEVASPVVAEYEALVRNLHCLAKATLRFDDGAQRYRQELEVKHLNLQSLEFVHRKLAAHIGKYDGIFARLCVIWHCIENMEGFGDVPSVISEATARRVGAFLHGFLLPHAIAFYTTVLGFSNDHDCVTAVAGYILSHGLTKITNRDLKRGDRIMRRLSPEAGLAVFEQLEAFGWLERAPSPLRGAPAHWLVNPAAHQKFAERAKTEATRRAEVRQTIADAVGRGVEP
ncbi:DUF3987 domain-containing protein [Bradyrhizobium sp. RD5-C2]|uniref:DUF3987 domain-containing protein n=1 Tax=Bradyrhizobium sp. RD5-C2 TaxID=244562 RepID=UPI001CC5111D|nr:DUF3987 domain-containing protein [Bradyrhizobium sp. RD5-C2]GIQ77089.1 hypothetical protein BraRD5C2_55370 [Bradyrhizobium sp. RD5-C2]